MNPENVNSWRGRNNGKKESDKDTQDDLNSDVSKEQNRLECKSIDNRHSSESSEITGDLEGEKYAEFM